MVDITILEVHLPDGQFNAPFSVGGDTGSENEDPGSAPDSSNDAKEGSPGGAIAALLVLAGLAALAWYLRRGR